MKKSNKPGRADLYHNRYVTALKVLQIYGYFFAVFYGFQIGTLFGFLNGSLAILGLSIFNFISTQGVIAVINLLSRIEYNTRSESNNDQVNLLNLLSRIEYNTRSKSNNDQDSNDQD